MWQRNLCAQSTWCALRQEATARADETLRKLNVDFLNPEEPQAFGVFRFGRLVLRFRM